MLKTLMLSPECKAEYDGQQWILSRPCDKTHHKAKNLMQGERWVVIGYCVSRVGLINVLNDNSIVPSKEGREFIDSLKQLGLQ